MDRLRIDKWLWAARFYKTRRLAGEALGHGRVTVNGVVAKASREVKPGDQIRLSQGTVQFELTVLGLSGQRGPAVQAQLLYAETAESRARREQQAQLRRLAPEPAHDHSDGRPTKRDRRQLERLQAAPESGEGWGERWSAQLP